MPLTFGVDACASRLQGWHTTRTRRCCTLLYQPTAREDLISDKTKSPPIADEAETISERGRRYPPISKVPHLTVQERIARGKAARADTPRSSHGVFELAANRPDPITLLREQDQTRVQELVPIRYGRMLVSPFTFYRGAALVMATDLASTPTSGLRAQLCGDAHLSNFGVFGSPERRLMFDANDFDETNPGPWEWDLKRLAASLSIAARNNEYTDAERRKIVMECGREYRTAMTSFAAMTNLQVWYAHLDIEKVLEPLLAGSDPKRVKAIEKNLARARSRDSIQVFTKLTGSTGAEPRILGDPPLIVPIEDLLPEGADLDQTVDDVLKLIRNYRKTLETDRRHLLEGFRFVHMARKVVGVGSVGTRAWIILLLGRDGDDPLFLQAKEAQASVLERFVGASVYTSHGQRVVAGQRLMQATSDIFLGWERVTSPADGVKRDYYIRQLKDMKGSVEVEAMLPAAMVRYGKMCAWTLARAHARSGDRIAISSYMGKSDTFDRAIADFSETYADQNERDFEMLAAAVRDGEIEVRTGL